MIGKDLEKKEIFTSGDSYIPLIYFIVKYYDLVNYILLSNELTKLIEDINKNIKESTIVFNFFKIILDGKKFFLILKVILDLGNYET